MLVLFATESSHKHCKKLVCYFTWIFSLIATSSLPDILEFCSMCSYWIDWLQVLAICRWLTALLLPFYTAISVLPRYPSACTKSVIDGQHLSKHKHDQELVCSLLWLKMTIVTGQFSLWYWWGVQEHRSFCHRLFLAALASSCPGRQWPQSILHTFCHFPSGLLYTWGISHQHLGNLNSKNAAIFPQWCRLQ